jgi:hypothetical protein
MNFVDFEHVQRFFKDKSVAIVGGGPSALNHKPGIIDSHDIVVRVNNYKTGPAQGKRADVFYSYFGGAIKKSVEELKRDGVQICMCKCPDDKPIACEWHERNGKLMGIDFRYIYKRRASWWFCDTFIPSSTHFLRPFELLGRHIPTTGFSAILDVIQCSPRSVYLTGFDFFTSGIHNVNEPWQEKNTGDPIGHRPDLEAAWLRENGKRYPLFFDRAAMTAMGFAERAVA